MMKDEQVQYLANIYHLLLADAEVGRVEEKAFELIAREIGAGYFERRNALKSAEQATFQVRPVGRLSDRMRNLEDMLLAAYCNGVVDAAEKKLIVEFATQVAVNKHQFSVMKSEAKRRHDEFGNSVN